ncbi:MAG TPA: hypothetical protein VGB88_09045 [Alphaproteobacteria bacterium]
MIRTIMIALISATVVLAGVDSAIAQAMGPCLPHAEAVAKLGTEYGERQVGIGLGSRGSSVAELYVAESGTWTILITRTNGLSCIAASGDNWSSSPLLVDDAT